MEVKITKLNPKIPIIVVSDAIKAPVIFVDGKKV